MQVTFRGMALKQQERPVRGKYPASVDITMIDMETTEQMTINSPVAVEAKHLLVPVDWTLAGFSVQTVNWKDKDTGEQRSFTKLTAKGITGSLVKGS